MEYQTIRMMCSKIVTDRKENRRLARQMLLVCCIDQAKSQSLELLLWVRINLKNKLKNGLNSDIQRKQFMKTYHKQRVQEAI